MAVELRGPAISRDKNISTTKMAIATKFGKMLTYHEGLPPITSHDCLIDKLKTSLIPQCFWPQELAG